MRIETDRLVIRDWQSEDADAAFAIYGDPEVMRYVGTGQPHESLEHTKSRLAMVMERDNGQPLGLWAVDDKVTGELVGGGLLRPLPDDTDIEVGYHLGKKWWGRGLATEIAIALIKYGFSDAGLEKIVGVTYPQNIPSRRVLEKAGMHHVGESTYGDITVERYEIYAGAVQ